MYLNMFDLRLIQKSDNPHIARVIRTVMPEYGASGEGYSIGDFEVDDMFASYSQPRSAYYVIIENSQLIGGGGIAPLVGGARDICELRKMYFLKNARGRGFGQRLIDLCLARAKEYEFGRCYLETLQSMKEAQALYKKNGFAALPSPMGRTGHYKCNSWYLKSLF
jgi:putative acetyltransferase